MRKFITIIALIGFTASAHAAWQTPGTPTVEFNTAQATPGVTATIAPANDSYFNVTAADVGKAVAEQIVMQGVEKKADVDLAAGSPGILYSANHAITVSIHALQVDTQSHRWQAQAYFIANGKTETVKPISGTYLAMVDVPVLIHQVGRGELIEASDITTKSVPDRLLRKDTVADAGQLIGQSPRMTISANRPIRMNEVSAPVVVKRGSPVELTYTPT